MAQWTQGVGQRRLWKAEEFDGLKPTVYDWCRVAAFLDGEGNLNINPIQDYRRVALKNELHKLNAKGCDNQIVIAVSDLQENKL